MQLTPANLNYAFNTYDTQYQAAFEKTPIYWTEFTSMVPSTTRLQTHAFLDRVPQLRQWIGDRQVQNFKARSLQVLNLEFELTQSIRRTEFEDDIYGIYSPAIQVMGESAKRWVDNVLILPAVQGGANLSTIPQSYDNVPFYSASHPIDASNPSYGSPQSNLFTSATSGALPLSPANYQIARQTMMSYLGADGTPLNVIPNILLVPPQLERTAKTIVGAEMIGNDQSWAGTTGAAPESNVLKGTAKVVCWPSLANQPTTWYLLDGSRALKPFIYQNRIAPQFSFLNKPTDTPVFMQDEFIYGVRARGAGAFGMWWLAAQAVG